MLGWKVNWIYCGNRESVTVAVVTSESPSVSSNSMTFSATSGNQSVITVDSEYKATIVTLLAVSCPDGSDVLMLR